MKKLFLVVCLSLGFIFYFTKNNSNSRKEVTDIKTSLTQPNQEERALAGKAETIKDVKKEVENQAVSQDNSIIQKIIEFQKLMPKNSDLSKLTKGEKHHTPQAIIKAGEEIAILLEECEGSPQNVGPISKAFSDCSQNSEVVASVRAMCRGAQRKIAPNSLKALEGSYATWIDELSKEATF